MLHEESGSETPVSPVSASQTPDDLQDYRAEGAGGLLGSPRPQTPVSPVSPLDDFESACQFFEEEKVAESVAQKDRAQLRSTVFSVMQYERHADTGRIMLTQQQIDAGLAMASIRKHAYAWHDLDRFDDAEALQQRAKGRQVQAGDLKPRHLHLVIACDHDYSVRQISDWLMIPSARVKIPKELAALEGRKPHAGRGAREKAFFDLCQYLTHEGSKQQSKHQYARSVVVANFDFEVELDSHMGSRTRTGGDGITAADRLALRVLHGELSVTEAIDADPLTFSRFDSRIRRMRAMFLAHQPPAPHRINLYLEGTGGIGKDLLAKALARTLVPGDWIPGLRDPFFACGGDNVAWDGYDGQPVVIIEEARAGALIKKFGRTELFQFLSPFPTRQLFNVKGASTQLLHTITILTGPDPYETFLNGLAGEYVDKYGTEHKAENKAQAYRRFPIIIPVQEGSFSLLVLSTAPGTSRSTKPTGRFARTCSKSRGVSKVLPISSAERRPSSRWRLVRWRLSWTNTVESLTPLLRPMRIRTHCSPNSRMLGKRCLPPRWLLEPPSWLREQPRRRRRSAIFLKRPGPRPPASMRKRLRPDSLVTPRSRSRPPALTRVCLGQGRRRPHDYFERITYESLVALGSSTRLPPCV